MFEALGAMTGMKVTVREVADMPLPWEDRPAEPEKPALILGLDLGQAADPSALVVAERTKAADPDDPARRVSHYKVRHIRRWPLGTSYVKVVADVAKLVREKLPLCRLVLDASGCGRPVLDMIRRERLPLAQVAAGVVITAGHAETRDPVSGMNHVAKVVLINMLKVLLGQRRLKFAWLLRGTRVLVKELQNYRMKVTPAANETFSAREGEHDDVLLALAVAVWLGERFMREPRIG